MQRPGRATPVRDCSMPSIGALPNLLRWGGRLAGRGALDVRRSSATKCFPACAAGFTAARLARMPLPALPLLPATAATCFAPHSRSAAHGPCPISPYHRFSPLHAGSRSAAGAAPSAAAGANAAGAPYLAGLNADQMAAVTSQEQHLRILAGPGSGKTRVAVSRVAHLLAQGVSPQAIIMITFTNKAAGEMRQRLKEMLAGERRRPCTAGTFHSICGRMLRCLECIFCLFLCYIAPLAR